MRKTKTCPKCACKKLLAIAMVGESLGSGSSPTQARVAVRHEGYSMLGNQKWKLVGSLEAVMCSDCGYTEYYCANPKEVEPDGKFISWLT